jgi:PTS system mannose-specific IIA component
VSLEWNQTGEDARDRIARGLAEADDGGGAVILTDMFGGTPTNIAATFMGKPVEIVTGVNLPMVIKLAEQDQDEPLEALARRIRDEGQCQIHLAGEILKPKKQ